LIAISSLLKLQNKTIFYDTVTVRIHKKVGVATLRLLIKLWVKKLISNAFVRFEQVLQKKLPSAPHHQ
jgi:hypothetical protein